MAHQDLALRADPAAVELAGQMLEREDVRREILEETIASARDGAIQESGRTVCGTARHPLMPLERQFSRITLPTCPVDVGGTWHTHVTTSQLLNPENSLPDFANVAFGIVDVSIVAGAESSHVVVATEDRAAMQQVLVDELGIQVRGVSDVADAVIGGGVDDPPRVRRRLYQRLGPELVYRVDTAAPGLAREIEQLNLAQPAGLAAPAVAMSGCTMYELYARHPHLDGGRMGRVCAQGRQVQDSVRAVGRQATDVTPEGFNFKQQVLATTISVAVGGAIERVLFG